MPAFGADNLSEYQRNYAKSRDNLGQDCIPIRQYVQFPAVGQMRCQVWFNGGETQNVGFLCTCFGNFRKF